MSAFEVRYLFPRVSIFSFFLFCRRSLGCARPSLGAQSHTPQSPKTGARRLRHSWWVVEFLGPRSAVRDSWSLSWGRNSVQLHSPGERGFDNRKWWADGGPDCANDPQKSARQPAQSIVQSSSEMDEPNSTPERALEEC